MGSGGFDQAFQQSLAHHSWTMYARWRRVRSISRLAVDDWIMLTAVPLFYTGLVVSLNVIVSGGGSNLFPPEQFETFSQEDIDERIKGSKIVVVSEQCMLNVIWILKSCMLFMLARMTTGTGHTKWIRIAGIWAIAGYFGVQIAFFTTCRPFTGYWEMPPPDPQCATLQYYAVVQAVFNISSDLLIIAIPIPMVASLSLPIKQKLGLGVLFGMGAFVILAAVLTKVYNLSKVYSTRYMLWYVREASVAVYVANLPGIWPLLREHIRFLREHTNSFVTGATPRTPHYGYGSQYGKLTKASRSRTRPSKNVEEDEVELGVAHAKSVAQSNHSTDMPHRLQGQNPFTSSAQRPSQDSDGKAGNEVLSSWKGTTAMGVQVDMKTEIQRGEYDDSGLETRKAQVAKIEGPDAHDERRQ
ncbi:hypothetical protein LEMA_P024380.1 [Plenodomus lingam JN3]|uniref:Rhodopsin domain-containing protein n=1 Tax=Leptosphaeria maculans (strain JN3 / isolate v23.1.3 / race Av1-4-5-6-7-8) TaxID=985895 RepID=E4ZX76_LEPMJ|nr:hypothetical protein LEMA_P024380.1 [Plenodomus lingam JN3]CBX95286.1 hypothetical protein LEMA_P024380.1 [Plenodomus lingam JN3]